MNRRFILSAVLIVADDVVELIDLASSSCKLAEVLHNQSLLKFSELMLLFKYMPDMVIKPQWAIKIYPD